jgi:hypothetical protein
MTDQEHNQSQDNPSDTGADETYSVERRRFLLKGALVSAPVILTVASRPVWAGGRRHGGGGGCALSGQLSGNLSQPEEECGGEGCTPGYWMQDQHLDSWCTCFPPSTLFVDAFGVDAFPGLTLLQVIRLGRLDVNDSSIFDLAKPPPGCNPVEPYGGGFKKKSYGGGGSYNVPDRNYYNMLRQLAFHSVAALQNAGTTVCYDLTIDDVINSFVNAYQSCNASMMESAKDSLAYLNEQYCPLN